MLFKWAIKGLLDQSRAVPGGLPSPVVRAVTQGKGACRGWLLGVLQLRLPTRPAGPWVISHWSQCISPILLCYHLSLGSPSKWLPRKKYNFFSHFTITLFLILINCQCNFHTKYYLCTCNFTSWNREAFHMFFLFFFSFDADYSDPAATKH